MGSRIPQNVIDEVISRAAIVEVVGDYVRLQRKGTRLVGLCPFHNEKSPSFSVNAERGLYHCFGCGVSGNTVGFLQKHDGLTFPEAIRKLAERYAIHIPEAAVDEYDEKRRRDERDRYDAVMSAAKLYYASELWSGRHAAPLQYLEQRGVDRETAERFGLGFAPAGWSGLVDALGTRSIPTAWLEEAGMAMPSKQGGWYDRFRNRVMFPIENVSRKVLAFSGRTLDAEEQAKYVNSPETAYYRKGNELFGLHAATKEIRRVGTAVLVEGNFDVVSLHARGITNVCAALGTAMTESQARLLRRFSDRVVLLYDGDAAGRKAARRALSVLLDADMPEILLCALPDGVDPDDFVRKPGGGDELKRMIDGARPMLRECIDDIVRRWVTRAITRRAATDELAELLSPVRNPIARAEAIEEAGRRLDLDPRELGEYIRKHGPMLHSDGPPPPPLAPAMAESGDGIVLLEPLRIEPLDAIESMLVELLADMPSLLGRFHREQLAPIMQHSAVSAFVAFVAYRFACEGGPGLIESLADADDDAVRSEISRVLNRSRTIPQDAQERAFDQTTIRMKLRWLDDELRRIEEQIREFETKADVQAVGALYKRHEDLLRWGRSLKAGVSQASA